MYHQHLSFSYTTNAFFLVLLDTPIPSPFISMCLLQISRTGSMKLLKSNCWFSSAVITTQSIGFYVFRPSDCIHSELSEASGLRPGQADCNAPLLQKACAEDISCMSRDEMQSQLLWRPGAWVEFPQARACLEEDLIQNQNSSCIANSFSGNLH